MYTVQKWNTEQKQKTETINKYKKIYKHIYMKWDVPTAYDDAVCKHRCKLTS